MVGLVIPVYGAAHQSVCCLLIYIACKCMHTSSCYGEIRALCLGEYVFIKSLQLHAVLKRRQQKLGGEFSRYSFPKF